jgi:O-antigen/teichoic acid export membrane protein
VLRIAADAYGYVLLALHRDRAIAIVALAGAAASAGLNLILTPLAGLWGAAAAYVLTSGGLFAARFYFSRQAKGPAAASEAQSSVRQESPIPL